MYAVTRSIPRHEGEGEASILYSMRPTESTRGSAAVVEVVEIILLKVPHMMKNLLRMLAAIHMTALAGILCLRNWERGMTNMT